MGDYLGKWCSVNEASLMMETFFLGLGNDYKVVYLLRFTMRFVDFSVCKSHLGTLKRLNGVIMLNQRSA